MEKFWYSEHSNNALASSVELVTDATPAVAVIVTGAAVPVATSRPLEGVKVGVPNRLLPRSGTTVVIPSAVIVASSNVNEGVTNVDGKPVVGNSAEGKTLVGKPSPGRLFCEKPLPWKGFAGMKFAGKRNARLPHVRNPDDGGPENRFGDPLEPEKSVAVVKLAEVATAAGTGSKVVGLLKAVKLRVGVDVVVVIEQVVAAARASPVFAGSV
jgi:hypothetical protein